MATRATIDDFLAQRTSILMFTEPAAFYHRMHRFVWRLLGKLPR